MSLTWEKVQLLLHYQTVRESDNREFSCNESVRRLAYARERNLQNHKKRVEFAVAVAELFPSVKGGQVVDSGRVKRK